MVLAKESRRIKLALVLGAFTCAQLGLWLSSRYIPAAYAQDFTEEAITNYARTVLDIEPIRLEAYAAASDILSATDSEVDILDTSLSCTGNRLSDMPDIPRSARVDLRTVLITFCNAASQAAEANDLTPMRFNDITEAHRADSELAERIQAAIREL